VEEVKHMRSQHWTTIVAAAVALVLNMACGGGAPGSAGQQGQAGNGGQKVKLVYFNARGAEAVERKLVERYVKEHPNIEVDYLATTTMQGPSDTDSIANLIFNIQAGTPVDVAKVEVGRTPLDLMAASANLELTKIGGEAVSARLNDLENSNLVQIKGGVWALPYEYDPFGYVYNATLFKEVGLDPDNPPATWDELRAAATTIKSKFPDTWPICHPLKNLSKIQPYVWGAGGTFWDRDVLPTKSDLLNPGARAGYAFIREWAQNGWLNTEELNAQKVVQLMVSRQCAGVNYSTNLARQLRANDPSTEWRVAAIPPMDASYKPINFAGGSALVVPATSKYQKEALDFILWLTDEKAQRLKWGVDPGLEVSEEDLAAQATPANRKVASDPQLATDAAWKDVFIQVETRPAGISPVYSRAYEVLAEMQERIVRTNSDLDAELKAAQEKIQALIDENMQKQPELYQS
jgi:multiple sugar transport system substrate-binding protein